MAKDDDDGPKRPRRSPSAGAPHLAALSEKARDYARNARSENTRRAYDADWRQFAAWLRRQGLDPLPPDPQTVGLYLAACMEELARPRAAERRLAGAPALRHLLALPPARRAARHRRPAYFHGARRHPPRPWPPAGPEGGDLRRRAAGDAGDARHGSARPARPRHSGASASPAACAAPRSSASIAAPIRPRTGPAGSRFFARPTTTAAAAHPQRQDRLARGRNRPRLASRHLPRRPARDLDAARPDQPRARCFGRSRARTAASPPSG